MPLTAVNQFSTTAASNTDVNSVDTSSTMVPADINDAFQNLMKLLKEMESGVSSMTSPDINGGTINGLSSPLAVADGGTGATTAGAARTALGVDATAVSDSANASTGWLDLPSGTTAQRGSPTSGAVRFNTTDSAFEGYDGSAWAPIGGGNSTDEGLWEHSATISANYSISSGSNAISAGPVAIASGVSVTVPSGSVWRVV